MVDQPDSQPDARIPAYVDATNRLLQEDFDLDDLPVNPNDSISELGQGLQALAHHLEWRYQEIRRLQRITTAINAGLLLDEILDRVYQDFKGLIPYQRIGFSLIEEVHGHVVVRARWAHTEMPTVKLNKGYSAGLAGSSLEDIIRTRQPRILNDLEAYLAAKPGSESTRLIVEEGFRSSLTCPLINQNIPVGFIFFSSVEHNAYTHVHVDVFQQIAAQLSVILEKGRLVSELAQQKEAVQQQNEELRALNELKNTFLGMAAHDLRNPLTVLYMGASMLMDPNVNMPVSEMREVIRDMYHQAEQMQSLINDYLDVSQIESGKLSLSLSRVALDQFLAEAARRNDLLSAAKQTHVVLGSAPAAEIWVDASRLRQVIDNLLTNAVKFSPPGSQVTINAQRETKFWRISVTDQGPGISEADRTRMFQYFSTLTARPTGDEKSTGLGLAISRRIVEAHGGKIGVDSVIGQGATFWFTVPIEPRAMH